jgi:hypothetical protein
MAGTFALDSTSVGASIDTNATLTTINYLAAPDTSDYHDHFCLVDNNPEGFQPVTVFNFNPSLNGGFSPDAAKNLLSFDIPFIHLVLQSCPDGATFNVTTV